MIDLQDAVKQCVSRLERHRQQARRIGEQNTKAGLIEPILGALGWDLLDPDEVHREYRRRSVDNPVDYALLLSGAPRLLIEAKGFGENLNDPKWANQTISYAAVAGVEWVALTDGAEWRIYNVHAPVPIEHKLFKAVRLEDNVDDAAEVLALLSKQNIREHRIDQLWQDLFVNRQVHAAVVGLFSGSEPNSELVTLLHQQLPRLSREDIRSGLIRSRVTLEFPTPSGSSSPRIDWTPSSVTSTMTAADPAASTSLPTGAVRQSTASPSGRSSSARKTVSDEERRIRIIDMIAVGRLRPGQVLWGRYLGDRHTAELLADGTIRYGGDVHRTPSAAGVAVKVSVHGPGVPYSKAATDGLEFWHTEDVLSGDMVSLKEIRRRTANDTNR